jgi:hypothetical protein
MAAGHDGPRAARQRGFRQGHFRQSRHRSQIFPPQSTSTGVVCDGRALAGPISPQ